MTDYTTNTAGDLKWEPKPKESVADQLRRLADSDHPAAEFYREALRKIEAKQ